MTKITNRCASIGDLAMKICLTFIKNQTNFGRIQKDSEGTAAGIYACQRLQDNAFCPSSSQRLGQNFMPAANTDAHGFRMRFA